MKPFVCALLSAAIAVYGCGGSDEGGKPALEVKPGQSIQAAIDLAKPGEVVLLLAGVHKAVSTGEAMIVFRKDKNGVVLRGDGKSPDEVVIDGDGKVLHVIFFDEGIDRNTVVENVTITGGNAYPAAVLSENHTPILRPEITDLGNDFYNDGAGIMAFNSAPVIHNSRIINNKANMCGGGISVFHAGDDGYPAKGPLITGNEISGNVVENGTGGGVDVYFGAKADIINNLLVGNRGWGGAIAVLDNSTATIDCCTIAGNYGSAPGVAKHESAVLTLTNSIFTENHDGIAIEISGPSAFKNCLFWNNDVPWEPPGGSAHILKEHLFVKGPRGDYYLSHKASGQANDSPGIDAGSVTAETAGVQGLTTRTDGVSDDGIVDIGF
ncbi:MAG: right-handed parallel beta-helix repeat-containing protein, partial [Deltaproteobacteria bacterium]|nr:right-handed parallel beta-helix repeat-containing protein [Deltaproteobacteria bacterium]